MWLIKIAIFFLAVLFGFGLILFIEAAIIRPMYLSIKGVLLILGAASSGLQQTVGDHNQSRKLKSQESSLKSLPTGTTQTKQTQTCTDVAKLAGFIQLAPEQEALIPEIQRRWLPSNVRLSQEDSALISSVKQKWDNLSAATHTDFYQAEQGIRLAYRCAGLKPPRYIHWCSNPPQGQITSGLLDRSLQVSVKDVIFDAVVNQSEALVKALFGHPERRPEIANRFSYFEGPDISSQIYPAIGAAINKTEKLRTTDYNWLDAHAIDFLYWSTLPRLSFLDFCHQAQIADFSHLQGLWQMAAGCSYVWAFEQIAIAVPKPIAIHKDSAGEFHAEGKGVVEWVGFSAGYYHHGVELPPFYGQRHPAQWQARWLLKEKNAELRRILIQEIGYARICQELHTVELDHWQEYTLLRLEAAIDGFDPEDFDPADGITREPIHLLKMTCPSTGAIHVLRVPPDLQSARDAIRWVNWGVDPEEFTIQT